MHEALVAIEARLAHTGVMRTRLLEQSAQDVLDLMPVEGFALSGLTTPTVVAALVTLEQGGVVQRVCERVHPHDSTEYYMMWRLAREASHRPVRP